MRPRRGFSSSRRRPPVTFGTFGFLRPPRRHEKDQRLFMERVRQEPNLRREYRASLVIQLVVVGALLLACVVLVLQSAIMLRQVRVPAADSFGWLIPAVVGMLALAVLRRFLRILSDYRSLRDR